MGMYYIDMLNLRNKLFFCVEQLQVRLYVAHFLLFKKLFRMHSNENNYMYWCTKGVSKIIKVMYM